MSEPEARTPPPSPRPASRQRSAAPLGYHLDAEGLLVPDTEPGDSRGFVVGLWVAEGVLLAALLTDLFVQPLLGTALRVALAFGGVLLFVSTTALHERAKVRPPASAAGKVASVAAVLVAGAWLAAAVALATTWGSGVSGSLGPRILTGVVGEAVLMVMLAVTYRSRMFHWRKPWVAPPR